MKGMDTYKDFIAIDKKYIPWLIGAVFLGSAVFSGLVQGFTEPTAPPPLNNVPPPFTPPTGSVGGTNAPYIQLLVCQKN
jgi:hypothetical protein